MKKIEWIREALSAWPSAEYLNQREAAGWRMVAVEWEREVQVEPAAASTELVTGEEIPYGTRIAGDCLHLEENPTEMQVLNHLAEMIVQDQSYRGSSKWRRAYFPVRNGKIASASFRAWRGTPSPFAGRSANQAPRINANI